MRLPLNFLSFITHSYVNNTLTVVMPENKMTLEELQALKAEYLRLRNRSSNATKAFTETTVASGQDLTDQVLGHVEQFLTSEEKYFSNERDIQVRLAHWLVTRQDNDGTPFYDFIDMEYGVPLSVLSDSLPQMSFPEKQGNSWTSPESFPWHNNLSIDLVVCKNSRWVAIELKYATRRIDADLFIFGESIGKQGALANQATANLAMYAYWKDVRRLEALCRRFKNIAGGLSVMVSNNSDCWKKPYATSLYTDFSMHIEEAGEHLVGGRVLKWKEGTSEAVADGHPNFLLEGRYPCKWSDTGITARTKSGNQFKFMITKISKI